MTSIIILIFNLSNAIGISSEDKKANADICQINKLKFLSIPYWIASPKDCTLW